MRSRVFAVLCLWAFCAPAALADQYAFTTLDQAVAAMKAVGDQHVVHSFCAPCNETASIPIRVESLGIARIWDGASADPYRNYWELQINGTGVDLAYVYIHKDGEWRNLATMLGLPVHASPERLQASQIGR